MSTVHKFNHTQQPPAGKTNPSATSYVDTITAMIDEHLPDHVEYPVRAALALVVLVRGATATAQDVHDALNVACRLDGDNTAALMPYGWLGEAQQTALVPYLRVVQAVARGYTEPVLTRDMLLERRAAILSTLPTAKRVELVVIEDQLQHLPPDDDIKS